MSHRQTLQLHTQTAGGRQQQVTVHLAVPARRARVWRLAAKPAAGCPPHMSTLPRLNPPPRGPGPGPAHAASAPRAAARSAAAARYSSADGSESAGTSLRMILDAQRRSAWRAEVGAEGGVLLLGSAAASVWRAASSRAQAAANVCPHDSCTIYISPPHPPPPPPPPHLLAHVPQVAPREARRARRKGRTLCVGQLPRVAGQDGGAAGLVGEAKVERKGEPVKLGVGRGRSVVGWPLRRRRRQQRLGRGGGAVGVRLNGGLPVCQGAGNPPRQQRRVEVGLAVGGADHDRAGALEAVNLAQQHRQQAAARLGVEGQERGGRGRKASGGMMEVVSFMGPVTTARSSPATPQGSLRFHPAFPPRRPPGPPPPDLVDLPVAAGGKGVELVQEDEAAAERLGVLV
jgi:hypothetical protein